VKIGPLLAHLHELETELAAELRAAAERHRGEHDVYHQCQTFALAADKRVQRLDPLERCYDGSSEWTTAVGEGSDDLLRELRTLYLRAQEVAITWTMASQAAKALRDRDLLTLATECQSEPEAQAQWFTTRIKVAAPQAIVLG
jgi:Lon protease-like protein